MFAFSLLLLLFAGRADAATYNFYFNNTEQGDNSHAAPTVVVKEAGKGGAQSEEEREDGADGGSDEGEAEGGKAPGAPVGASSVAAAPAPATPPVARARTHRVWRLGAHLVAVGPGRETRERGRGGFYSSGHSSQSSASVSATFLPSPYLGLSVIAGTLSAFEAELNLLPSNAVLSLGILGGYGKAAGAAAAAYYWGLQLGLDLADLTGIQFSWRDFGPEGAAAAGVYWKF
jgi:hypothetical protein